MHINLVKVARKVLSGRHSDPWEAASKSHSYDWIVNEITLSLLESKQNSRLKSLFFRPVFDRVIFGSWLLTNYHHLHHLGEGPSWPMLLM